MIKTRTGGRQDYIMNQYEIIFGLKEGRSIMDLFGFIHGECWALWDIAYGTWALTFTFAVCIQCMYVEEVHRPTNNFVVLWAICFMFEYVYEYQRTNAKILKPFVYRLEFCVYLQILHTIRA